MAGWHHRCNGHELGQTSGDGERQGGLALQSRGSQRVRHDWMMEQQQQCRCEVPADKQQNPPPTRVNIHQVTPDLTCGVNPGH